MNTRLQAGLFTVVYACGIIWAIWLAQIHISGRSSLIDRLETYLLDLSILVNGPQSPHADVIIVAIDDETVDDLGRFPVERSDIAAIVEKSQPPTPAHSPSISCSQAPHKRRRTSDLRNP